MPSHERTGYLAGVFDYCHEGHVNIIRRASRECDVLVVAVVADNFASRYKPQALGYDEQWRLAAVEGLDIAQHVVLVDNNDHEPFYREYEVTHLFHGTDWDKESYIDFMGCAAINRWKIQVVMLPHTPGISSSQLRERAVSVAKRDKN